MRIERLLEHVERLAEHAQRLAAVADREDPSLSPTLLQVCKTLRESVRLRRAAQRNHPYLP